MLSEAERSRVEAAIREAERGTAGEIVLVIARRAASYRSVPLAAALTTALVVPWLAFAATGWPMPRILLVQLVATLAILLLTAAPGLRVGLVPASVRRRRGREAAEREFRARGMAETRGRTGVLIYLAQAEQHAEIMGDVAIAGAVPEERWRGVVEDLLRAIGAGHLADGLVGAVEEVGVILAATVPPGQGDTDELPNRVVLV